METVCQDTERLLQIWDYLVVHNSILFRLMHSPKDLDDNPTIQQVKSKSLRDEILKYLHKGVMGGHLEVSKTLARLKVRCVFLS